MTQLAQLLEAVAVLDNHAMLARGPNWQEMLSARQAAALLRERLPELCSYPRVPRDREPLCPTPAAM